MSVERAVSMIVSYLWRAQGHTAFKAELGGLPITLKLAGDTSFDGVTEEEVYKACRDLSLNGWIDLVAEEGIPAARLTHEAVQALAFHARTGAQLPERLERAVERDARVAQEASSAQREQVQILREVREEARRAREEAAELRLEMQRMRELSVNPAPQRITAKATVLLQCKACRGTGVGAGVAGTPCPTCKGLGEVPAREA